MPRRNRQSLNITYPVPEGASPVTLGEEEVLPLLESGEITGGHRMPYGSNYTFLVWIDAGRGSTCERFTSRATANVRCGTSHWARYTAGNTPHSC